MINGQLLQQFMEFSKNPSQYAINHWGVDPNMSKDPNAIIQNMMQHGWISQERYNAARQAAYNMQNNPVFSQLFQKNIKQ